MNIATIAIHASVGDPDRAPSWIDITEDIALTGAVGGDTQTWLQVPPKSWWRDSRRFRVVRTDGNGGKVLVELMFEVPGEGADSFAETKLRPFLVELAEECRAWAGASQAGRGRRGAGRTACPRRALQRTETEAAQQLAGGDEHDR